VWDRREKFSTTGTVATRGLQREGRTTGEWKVLYWMSIITVTPTERIAVTTAQNRILPLLAHAAIADSAAADAYIPGQSQSIKNPNTNRITAIASAILLTLALSEAIRLVAWKRFLRRLCLVAQTFVFLFCLCLFCNFNLV
jgi:hypothetical protein